MKTITVRVTVFFIGILLFIGLLAGVYYETMKSLTSKMVIMQNFDSLLNDSLEMRRYEKNYTYYHYPSSLNSCMGFLSDVESAEKELSSYIKRVGGEKEYNDFKSHLGNYRRYLEKFSSKATPMGKEVLVGKIRVEGKAIVDFAQDLKKKKWLRIKSILNRTMFIPAAFLISFFILVGIVLHLLTQGILKPLSLVRKATDEVANGTFKPIAFPEGKRDEITLLIKAFNKMAEELHSRQEQLLQSRKLASIGTFAAGIAHELNNPLNNISLTTESLELGMDAMDEEEKSTMLHDIISEAERASVVVKGLLEFSRTEQAEVVELSIKELMDRTIRLVKNQVMLSGVELEKDIEKDLPAINGKPHDLVQAFLNIVVNAVQAMDESGTLTIKTLPGPEGYNEINITDTGAGIKPADLSHIFDPFYTTKVVGEGTGLGLSLVYGIIRSHGGYIEVNSKLGKGTTFAIFLPTAEKMDQAKADQDKTNRDKQDEAKTCHC